MVLNTVKSLFIPFICLILLELLATKAFAKEVGVPRTRSGRVDMCLTCHEEQPGKVHERGVVRCSDCHLGNSLSTSKHKAHWGMILNPGELAVAQKTCGRQGCHSKEVKWVKNTLMATNRGIISTLMYYWGDANSQYVDITVKDVMEMDYKPHSLDYFSKLCGTCHLWLPRGKYQGFLGKKGGGCSACHLLKDWKGKKKEKDHPKLVRAIPIENCERCHNRSGRIALSYQGKMETEGYGTPFEGGDFTDNELEDGRYVRYLPADVHFEKGLLCVDCHTQKETMGDGKKRAHMEEQLEVECIDCHSRDNVKKGIEKGLKIKINGDKLYFSRKKDKKNLELSLLDPDKCVEKDHKRLSCQACHSKWVPQCFGCHVTRDQGSGQMDWMKDSETPGRWKEYRSIMRYVNPSLGVYRDEGHPEGKIAIIVPG